jgi:hypothetical protein
MKTIIKNYNPYVANGDAQIFQIFRRHLRILDSRLVTWSKFHNEDSQIRVLGTSVKNAVTMAN